MQHRIAKALSFLAAIAILSSTPASAHEEHRRQREAVLKAKQQRELAATRNQPAAAAGDPTAMHAQMGEMTVLRAIDRVR